MNRQNNRRRVLQQRLSGFNINGKNSLNAISQSIQTLNMLEKQFIKPTSSSLTVTRIKSFDCTKRKIKIGQWIDVKDTIDQWLEAEVIDKRNEEVFVHYNGWGRRWDEWINCNSPRIAPFRSRTVNSGYSMLLSPNPCHSLDGDHTNVSQEDPRLEDVLSDSISKVEKVARMVITLQKTLRRKEEMKKMSEDRKHYKNSFSVNQKKPKTKKTMKTIKEMKKIKQLKKVFEQKNKRPQSQVAREETIETHSNFSLKINERNLKNMKKHFQDDCRSMKSLKLKDEPLQINIEDNVMVDIGEGEDSMSPHSLKSRLSSKINFNFDCISEKHEDQEDAYEKDIFEIQTMLANKEKKMINKELYIYTNQLAPFLDRVGRMLVDLAPHIAMIGSSLFPPQTSNISNVSLMTQNGSLTSGRMNDPVNRFLFPNNVSNRSAFHFQQQSTNPLVPVTGRTLQFEVPVMLTPGELMSVTPRNTHPLPEGNVHLHLRANVHLSDEEERHNLLGGQRARRRGAVPTKTIGTQVDYFNPTLKASTTKNDNEFDEEHYSSEMSEFSELQSFKKPRWEGFGSIRDRDLDNSFCGTIEERNESEEPDMQDISFKEQESDEKGGRLNFILDNEDIISKNSEKLNVISDNSSNN